VANGVFGNTTLTYGNLTSNPEPLPYSRSLLTVYFVITTGGNWFSFLEMSDFPSKESIPCNRPRSTIQSNQSWPSHFTPGRRGGGAGKSHSKSKSEIGTSTGRFQTGCSALTVTCFFDCNCIAYRTRYAWG